MTKIEFIVVTNPEPTPPLGPMTDRQRQIWHSHDYKCLEYTIQEHRDAEMAFQREQKWLLKQRIDAMTPEARQLYYDLFGCDGIEEGSDNEKIVKFILERYNVEPKDSQQS